MAISVVGAEKFEKKVEVVVPKVEGKTVGELNRSLYQSATLSEAFCK